MRCIITTNVSEDVDVAWVQVLLEIPLITSEMARKVPESDLR